MPMSRYQIRNAYSLADPELYRAADKDDPEALLEGVAMAGLVGVLRQLGDLAEFAAEIFHNLHEEVMATATRGHGLMVRVQQLEAEFPSIEKAFLSQTNHSAFFSNAGTDWHPNLHTNHNLVTQGDLPRFVMDSYEDCRGPPRLFLLDKFDVAGAGACLKRYTDPSFFKVEASSYGPTNAEVQREKKSRKPKKKGSRWRNGGTPEVLSTSNAKLHQLFLEERVENGVSDPARLVKLKRRLNGFPFTSKTGKSYMEKFINKSLVEDKVVHEICYGSSPLKLPSASDSGVEVLETSRTSIDRTVLRPSMDELREDLSDEELSSGPKQCSNSGTGIISPTLHEMVDEKEIVVDGESKTDGIIDGYQSDDIASEVDNYMDALATMDSEVEMDSEFRTKTDLSLVNIEKQGTDSDENEEQLQAQFSDSQSVGKFTASDDGNSSSKKGISSFSYSDTGSISAEVSPANEISKTEITDVSSEKIPENKEDTPFPANEISKTEITDMSSEKIPENKEDTPFQPPKHEGTHNAYIEVADIPSYMPEFGEPSSSASLTDSAPICLPVDQEELVEISSNHDELDKECMRTKESETKKGGNLPWKSRHSYLPSQTRDDFPITGTVSAENIHVDKLDDEDPVVHFSKNLEVVPKMESCESSLDNVLQTDHAEDGRDDVSETKNLVASRISSPHSVISHAEDEPSVPALLEFETCTTYLKPEVVDSIDDVVPSSREITVDSISALYNSDNTEQKDDVPPLKIDSVEVDIHYEENLSKEDDEEMAGIDSSMNLIGSDATTLEISSDFLNSIGPRSLTGFPLHLDERETEIGLSENVVASPDGDADEVDFSSTTKSREESIQKSDENDFAVHDYCLQQSHNTELGKQKEVINEEIASSPNSDSIPCEAPFCDHSVSELVNHFPDPLAAEAESKLRLDEATMVPMFPKSSGQDSELVSPKQSNLIVDTDDALPSSPHDFSERSTPFEQNLTLQADVDETKSKETSQWEQVQSPEHIDDHSEPIPPIVSEPVVQVDIESDRLDVESLQGVKSNCESSSKLEQMQFTDNERISDSSPKASSMHLPSEVSESEPLQTSTHKVGVSEQERDLFSSVPPGFPLFPPEVPNVNLEEMPPLPPLPPVQWRIGRPQQASPMVPSKADNNIQTGYPTLDGNILLPPAPVLSSSAVRDEDSQHTVHSSPFCMQMTIISSDRDSLIDYCTSDSTPNMVPLLTLPSTCNEGPQHGLIAGEVGVMQPSVDPFLTVTKSGDAACTYAPGSIHETLNHSQHLLPPDASLENERPERNFVSSEVKMVNLPETNSPQQTMADEEPKYVSTTSEGEILWSTSQSLFPAVEDGMLNGTRPMKLLRPRSPLIDAVAAHDKSKLRKVTERVRPETQKLEERDSLLEEIRAKSVNLKPAAVTRPSIKGPATNLRVAAILQKANAIRQALAGSDEDDDEDSWSDS